MIEYNYKILLLILAFIFCNSEIFSQHKIILSTNFDGEVISGSKEVLIAEIRKGKSIRYGYQLDFNEDKVADFDHWGPAEFITILGGEVFTQIRNINLQIPNDDIPQVDIIPVNTQWTAILGTNSILRNRFVYDDIKFDLDEEGKPIMTEKIEEELKIREAYTWKVATFWAVD